MTNIGHKPDPCACEICSLKIDFEIDSHLLSEVERQNCVIFAGAGISTETEGAHPNTLYSTLRQLADVEGEREFWEVVDTFERQPNGRQALVQLIKDRFSYIDAFRDLRWRATRFHVALGNAPYFKTIITTNWDRYFEDVIGATPFVYDSDIPFWEHAKRPVIKIHGSIDNYSSLVASSEDYNLCEARLREGALGAVVKQIFATKTCVFCGYSARDTDFRKIYETVRQGLGSFARAHYLVSPFITDEESIELKEKLGIISIKTDATHFLEVVKRHMSENLCFSRDKTFSFIAAQAEEFRVMHYKFVKSFQIKTHPHIIFSVAYQDGVIHAYERILDRMLTGEFASLHEVKSRIEGYSTKIARYKRERNYWDTAYFSGYQNGLIQFLMANNSHDEEAPTVPECYHPGSGEMYLEEYDEKIRDHPKSHKLAFREATKRVARFTSDSDVVLQHPPWG